MVFLEVEKTSPIKIKEKWEATAAIRWNQYNWRDEIATDFRQLINPKWVKKETCTGYFKSSIEKWSVKWIISCCFFMIRHKRNILWKTTC